MSKSVILKSPRLILRPHTLEDYPAMVELWSSLDVTRFTAGNRPSTPEEVWQRLLRYAGLWPLLGFGYFAVTLKETGKFVGEAGLADFHRQEAGLADFHRQIEPSMDKYAEAGWALSPDYWGNGYAREALSAILEWFAASALQRPVACIIDPDNTVSVLLARDIGFKEKIITRYNGNPCLMMEL